MVDRDKFVREHCDDDGPAGDVSLDKDEDDEDLTSQGPSKGTIPTQTKVGGKSGDPRWEAASNDSSDQNAPLTEGFLNA